MTKIILVIGLVLTIVWALWERKAKVKYEDAFYRTLQQREFEWTRADSYRDLNEDLSDTLDEIAYFVALHADDVRQYISDPEKCDIDDAWLYKFLYDRATVSHHEEGS